MSNENNGYRERRELRDLERRICDVVEATVGVAPPAKRSLIPGIRELLHARKDLRAKLAIALTE